MPGLIPAITIGNIGNVNVATQVNAPVGLNLAVLSGGPVAQLLNQALGNGAGLGTGADLGLGAGLPQGQ